MLLKLINAYLHAVCMTLENTILLKDIIPQEALLWNKLIGMIPRKTLKH